MQHSIFKHRFLQVFTFAALSFILLTAFTPGGQDQYSLYLNNTLIVKRFVGEPLTLKGLALDKANQNDKLIIHYRHCHGVGQDRKIILKNDEGDILKEWKFANVTDSKSEMVIPVKELLQLEKKNGRVTLHYISNQAPKGQMLVGLNLGAKKITT